MHALVRNAINKSPTGNTILVLMDSGHILMVPLDFERNSSVVLVECEFANKVFGDVPRNGLLHVDSKNE